MNQVDTYNEEELRRIVRTNRVILRLSRHWLTVALVFLFLYTSLAFTAPVLMEVGFTGAANVIYKLYSPLCHQFAFRSWFLFGDQPVYP
ncbi:MAG TPA: hypothetical protein VMT24_01265, partial [Aggregatilineaceae bacterium]|nr:hypothetical protein [Aggregatilineaceae bacterium]